MMHGMNTDDELVYWRERAKRAEQQLAEMIDARNKELDNAARIAEQLTTANAEIEELKLALSFAERLGNEQLDAMTKARDEACDRLEACWSRLYMKSEMEEVGDGGVAEFRKVGTP